MKITKDTTLIELRQTGIVDKDVYLYLRDGGYKVANDVILRSRDPVFWNSQKSDVRSFGTFLQGISDFIWRFENRQIDEEIETLLPHTLLFAIQSIYQNEKKRFNADYVLSLNLYDESDFFFPSFFYQLISDPLTFFDIDAFKVKFKRGEYSILDVDIEYERYKFAMTSIIVNIEKSLGNFPDCVYYKRLIDLVISELDISEKQINDAETYANLLNYHPANVEVIQTDNTSSLVYVNENIQKKYEELQKSLSVRTRNIIKNYIPKYTDFMPWVWGEKTEFNFRNCGKKSILELEGFLKEFRDYYNNDNADIKAEYKDNSDYVKTLSFLIELGVENKKYNTDAYRCLLDIYPQWEDFAVEMSSMEGILQKIFNYVPKQALDCMNWLADLFTNIVLLIANQQGFTTYISVFSLANKSVKKYIEENRTELEYQKYISDEKEIMLANTYQLLLSRTSVQCQNVVSNNNIDFRAILTYEGRESDFRNIRQVGRRCAEEMARLLDNFKPKYEKILKDGDDNAKVGNLQSQFPYLSEKDMKFVSRFEYVHQHLPMFYILSRYFEKTTNRKAQLFASYCGLAIDSVFSLDALSEKYNLTRERVRQIIEKRDLSTDDNFRKLIEQKHWQFYDLDFVNYLSDNNSIFNALSKEEQVDFSFFSYCNILSLFNRIKILNISETGKVLSSMDVEQYKAEDKPFKTYAYDSRYRSFRFGPVMNEVGRLLRLQRDVAIKIPLYGYFVTNPEYWINEMYLEDETVCKPLLEFFEVLISDTYGDLVENHNLVLDANKLNYTDILYDILKENGEKMHINDIYERFKALYPDCKYDHPKYLKSYMLRDERFENIGKSSLYQLTEWGGYSGSIPVLVVDLVSIMDEPISIYELAKTVLKHRSDSTEKSVLSIIYQCIKEDKLVPYYGDYVGAKGKVYDSSFILQPQNFAEWMEAFKSFTYQHQCFPIGASRGFEGALYNWYYDARSYINMSSEEILAFHALMQELQYIPHNTSERKFLNNCEAYKSFVKLSGRMLTQKDETSLYMWFRTNMTKYTTYEDNRHHYFKELINYLQDEFGGI